MDLAQVSNNENFGDKLIRFKQNQYMYYLGHYMELLLTLRKYHKLPNTVNITHLESLMRNYGNAVIGYNKFNDVVVLGYYVRNNDPNNLNNLYHNFSGTFIPKGNPRTIYKRENYFEITENQLSGNFIVLKNKPVQYVYDYNTLTMYAEQLSEIQTAIFSLVIQSKVMTAFIGDEGDVSLDTAITKLFSGSPVIKTTAGMDVNHDIIQFGGEKVSVLKELQDQKMRLIADLNNEFGINDAGIIKQSGVSDVEINSNNDKVNANTAIWTQDIQHAFDMWNTVYGTEWSVTID